MFQGVLAIYNQAMHLIYHIIDVKLHISFMLYYTFHLYSILICKVLSHILLLFIPSATRYS